MASASPSFVGSPRKEEELGYDGNGGNDSSKDKLPAPESVAAPEKVGSAAAARPNTSERQPLYRVVQYGLVSGPSSSNPDGGAPNWSGTGDDGTAASRTVGTSTMAAQNAKALPPEDSGRFVPRAAEAGLGLSASVAAAAATFHGGSSNGTLPSSAGLSLDVAMLSAANVQAPLLQSALLGSSQQLQPPSLLPSMGSLAPKLNETIYQQSQLLLLQQLLQLRAAAPAPAPLQQQGLLGQESFLLPNLNAPIPEAATREPTTETATCAAAIDGKDSAGTIPDGGSSEEESGSPRTPPAEELTTSRRTAVERPKRALSAYNLFFKDERLKLIRESRKSGENGKQSPRTGKKRKRKLSIGFEQMARVIGARWKEIGPELRSHYEEQAAKDKDRYQAQVALYNESKLDRLEAKRQRQEATVSAATMKEYLATGGGQKKPTKKKRAKASSS